VRGITSINGAEPLVLIDGAVGDLNRVNPNDVESISVIKDAAAAAVYGARAAFGVLLVTTKSGAADGKARVRYSGRIGWEEPTSSTDYENTGYWSVYTINKFWKADSGSLYLNYTDRDMQQLLARVNDKEEHPDRPWTVEEVRNGRKQWVYYGNYDWWDMLYRQKRPVQQHSVSLSGGTKDIKYLVSGAYDRQEGIQRQSPDLYQKYNLRSKIDFRINPWATLSNNTSFFTSKYTSLGDGSVDNTIGYSSRHALANIPMTNPDGSWIYATPYHVNNYRVANGRHIILGEGSHPLTDLTSDFANTSRLVVTPVKTFSVTADFTYRLYQARNMSRSNPMYYREYPDEPMAVYNTGAGDNRLDEEVNTRNYYSANAFASYEETFNGVHHLSGVAGLNYETFKLKNISAWGRDLSSTELNDLNLVGQNEDGNTYTGVGGGQNEYALMGYFGRINYDYKGRYLLELSGRYDGTSRFAAGHRWGWFPSGSAGWRISEEPFFEPARKLVDNLKLRVSYGSLGNQNVSSYYTYLRLISVSNFQGYTFGESSTMGKYSSLGAPVASDLTWETAKQWNLGLDATMLNNRLNITTDLYIRDTKDMLIDGVALPSVYGAASPKMNAADLRTKGYEFTVNWRDQFQLAGKPFEYGIGFNISDFKSVITKYDNPEKSLAKDYYEGMTLGEFWGFSTDGLFQSTEEAQAYAREVDLSYINQRITGGWQAGDLKFLDTDGDNVLGLGSNTVDDPGDRKILGNSLPSLSYGITANIRWCGFDVSVFFQGTGNHYWYPSGQMMNFWGPYSSPYLSFLPKDFLSQTWSEDNRDAYFTRPMAYSATSGPMSKRNDRYLLNLRYLRFKNLTVGYTLPVKLTKKARIETIRVYFSGENLCYWSPVKKISNYVDPEAVTNRSDVEQNAYYPWAKTFMFGIDITF
jgi:TonB-linked SusC/RagA family outer membrane protein